MSTGIAEGDVERMVRLCTSTSLSMVDALDDADVLVLQKMFGVIVGCTGGTLMACRESGVSPSDYNTLNFGSCSRNTAVGLVGYYLMVRMREGL